MTKLTELSVTFAALAITSHLWGWGGLAMVVMFLVANKPIIAIINELAMEDVRESEDLK